jgi:hypothetical protein
MIIIDFNFRYLKIIIHKKKLKKLEMILIRILLYLIGYKLKSRKKS